MRVFLSEYIDPVAKDQLAKKVEIIDSIKDIESVDAMVIRGIVVDKEMMEKAPQLKLIAKHGVGVNNIDLEEARRRGITVTNTPGANSDSVAELVVALLLASARRLREVDHAINKGTITKIAPAELCGNEVGGKILGQLGIGQIGSRVARIMHNGFGMRVLAYDPWAPESAFFSCSAIKTTSLEELLSKADVINISFGLTKETENLIHGTLFDYMKKDAILVNAARGGIVNEQDLYLALKNKKIKAAACDAFVNEPPTKKCSLFSLENFIGTPHIGADTDEALQKVGFMVVDEVIRFAEGKKVLHPVI